MEGYDGLVDIGFDKHLRVNHGDNEFACGERHINGIESFWGYAKKLFSKFNGIDKKMFYLHLKETEYRFNHRHGNLYLICLKYSATTLFNFLSPIFLSHGRSFLEISFP
jgi:transposase